MQSIYIEDYDLIEVGCVYIVVIWLLIFCQTSLQVADEFYAMLAISQDVIVENTEILMGKVQSTMSGTLQVIWKVCWWPWSFLSLWSKLYTNN